MRTIISISLLVMLFFLCDNAYSAAKFEVTGIIHKDKPMAIINGKIVEVGDEVDGATVEKINENLVSLRYKNKLIVKNVEGKLHQDTDVSKNNNKQESSRRKVSFLTQKVSPVIFFLVILFSAGAAFFLSKKSKK